MGLRERNAAATRELILDTALHHFLDRGYDRTTMEVIAGAAQIGTSTLYRYFPTKDQLVTAPLEIEGHLAAELEARPRKEPLDTALGHAVAALITTPRADTERIRQVQAVLDATPGLRARLQEIFTHERTLLEHAIARRLGRPEDDVYCVMTARMTTSILEIVGRDTRHTAPDNKTAARDTLAFTQRLLARLHDEPPVLPRLPV